MTSLKATKPAFGDARAPRRHDTADTYLVEELGFVHHQLDKCAYLSVREATEEDEPFVVLHGKTRA